MALLASQATLAAGCTKGNMPETFGARGCARFTPSRSAYFENAPEALAGLAARQGQSGRANHFCLDGFKCQGGYEEVWVHWREGERLLLWRGGLDRETRIEDLVAAPRDLRLGHDTVETEAEVGGSTYLVTRRWWESVAQDCDAYGERFTIAAATP